MPEHPTADWTPGVPIDGRTMAQIERARSGVRGDVEHSAAHVVARLTGERVEVIDDGHRDAMPDLTLTHADGTVAYVEVVVDADPAATELASLLRRRHFAVPAPNLRSMWWLTLAPPAKLHRIEVRAPALLAELEAAGYSVPMLTEVEYLAVGPPALARLVALGVAEIATGAPPRPGEEAIRLLAPGTGGYPEDSWDGFLAAVDELVHSPALEDVRSKLMRTGAAERHAFIGTTEASSWALNYWLSTELTSVPDAPPRLPSEITHLWLWGRTSRGRALAWFPDEGWLDARARWRTL